jgi:hypothetical protein
MAGLVPAIQVFAYEFSEEDVDARDKRGHDCISACPVQMGQGSLFVRHGELW